MTDKYLTVKDVAELLSLSPYRVRQLVRQGRFPGAKKIGSDIKQAHWRIPQSGIDNYLNPT